MRTPEEYMALALGLAREAAAEGEVPVGCVIAGPDGSVIGSGRNRREKGSDATAHAEMEAIRSACAALGSWRLTDCSMYVTLEPCPMCAGAVINARVSRLYYGAKEPNSGCCGSVLNLFMKACSDTYVFRTASSAQHLKRAYVGDAGFQLFYTR